ncbi:MAG: hypothetical protein OEW30_17375, partial [Acidimicrobiia bacterium]|nr:hypothetical protein [Acidimicrobiia bacterium]
MLVTYLYRFNDCGSVESGMIVSGDVNRPNNGSYWRALEFTTRRNLNAGPGPNRACALSGHGPCHLPPRPPASPSAKLRAALLDERGDPLGGVF